jgi:hypothetical protein
MSGDTTKSVRGEALVGRTHVDKARRLSGMSSRAERGPNRSAVPFTKLYDAPIAICTEAVESQPPQEVNVDGRKQQVSGAPDLEGLQGPAGESGIAPARARPESPPE